MNTFTRTANAQPFFHRINFIHMTAAQGWVMLLSAALFLSAFALVTVKDINRRLYADLQIIKSQNELHVERWSKLLLEQSTLTSEPRIEKIATKRLEMVLPLSRELKLISPFDMQAKDE